MRIYPLAIPCQEAATYLADVHLRHTGIAINKIISDAVHFRIGKDLPQKENDLGETEYWVKGVRILPRSAKISVWSKWAALNMMNVWWLVDFAFQCNREYKDRLGVYDDLPHYLQLQDWAARGVITTQVFPKPTSNTGSKLNEFPVVLPPKDVVLFGDLGKLSVVDIYRLHYANQKGKIRMKWSKREKPFFFDSDIPF